MTDPERNVAATAGRQTRASQPNITGGDRPVRVLGTRTVSTRTVNRKCFRSNSRLPPAPDVARAALAASDLPAVDVDLAATPRLRRAAEYHWPG